MLMESTQTRKNVIITAVYDAKKIRSRSFPESQNGEYCEYLGYIFSNEGDVCSPSGNVLINTKSNGKDSATVIIRDDFGKKHLVRVDIENAMDSMFSNGDVSIRMCEYARRLRDQKREVEPLVYMARTSGRIKKLTQEQLAQIRRDYYTYGLTYKELSDKYQACVLTIQKIIRNYY